MFAALQHRSIDGAPHQFFGLSPFDSLYVRLLLAPPIKAA
jgi:hypothetical protein